MMAILFRPQYGMTVIVMHPIMLQTMCSEAPPRRCWGHQATSQRRVWEAAFQPSHLPIQSGPSLGPRLAHTVWQQSCRLHEERMVRDGIDLHCDVWHHGDICIQLIRWECHILHKNFKFSYLHEERMVRDGIDLHCDIWHHGHICIQLIRWECHVLHKNFKFSYLHEERMVRDGIDLHCDVWHHGDICIQLIRWECHILHKNFKFSYLWVLECLFSTYRYQCNMVNQNIDAFIHWGRVTHICVSKLTIIGSDNGLSPGRR